MSDRLRRLRRRRRARRRLIALALGLLLAVLAFALAGWPWSGVLPHAAGASGEGEVSVQTDDSLPARDVTMIGSSPAEAAGETWGVGEIESVNSGHFAILEYSNSGGWRRAHEPTDATGKPLAEFQPDETPLMGDTTAGGDGVLIGTVHLEGRRHKLLLVRNPGGAFVEAPISTTGEGALIGPQEELYAEGRSPLIAPLEENGHAGALLVPVSKAPEADENRVLHWNGESWKQEPIEVPAATAEEGGGFRVLAIADSSPSNAWLLAQLSGTTRNLALYRRDEGHWIEVTPAPLSDEGEPFTVAGAGGIPHSTAQILTVTSQGVWVDGERADISEPVTMYFKPSSESEGANSGEVLRVWCDPGAVFPGGGCDEALPQALPTGRGRSFAWAAAPGSQPYGERVITGLGEGVTLRLEAAAFKRVLALGGSAAPNDVGASFGAAFSSAREGWLGNDELPVHLTPTPAPDKLQYYPVPFRHTLTAIAPQPGQPVGAPTSQALAVGDDGEVARYFPLDGWEPETLFGPGSPPKHETPRLRAVAWPTSSRAYAVGELGEMWLWRGETDLWEKDPATPVNFNGNLLGIAFDPAEASRGYAVGQEGVLMRFGKTWTQEPEANIPAEAQGASFTSVAFAGSEAIVAFRKVHLQTAEGASTEGTHYTGGIIVNEGSGWHIDQQAAEALGGQIPWAVAGLPDGGAAVSATFGGVEGSATILERNSQSAKWEAAPPYPGTEAPGSLAIFRENGAVRVIGSGGLPETREVEEKRPPPAGFPPTLVEPYPLASGYVIRQTADGWNDEEHARNAAQDPLGEYKFYDQVYEPDPTSAVLINENGSAGWAVGGFANTHNAALDTADVARYPAETRTTPPNVATTSPEQPDAEPKEQAEGVSAVVAEVHLDERQATFAIGGGAGCEAACADRARAGIGADVWLSTALSQAARIAGLRAFLYTGPRVTNGAGHANFPVPYAREFGRYAEVLGSAGTLPAYPAPSPSERAGNECEFQSAFASFAEPLGDAHAGTVVPVGGQEVQTRRAEGICSTYYAWKSTGAGGTVRVIVIDTSAEGAEWEGERRWLEGELSGAEKSSEPTIVVGNADLNARIAAGGAGSEIAAEGAHTIIAGHASAYFFDSPEQNIQEQLDGSSTPAFGSGTLGYVSAVKSEQAGVLGASGFLVVHVNVAAPHAGNVVPVTARLIPNIGEVALEGEQGTLLRRSEVANFIGLARRPRAGGRSQRLLNTNESNLYVPIPQNCVGSLCAHRIEPEFAFISSEPDFGAFVEPNLASAEGHAVDLNSEGKPIDDIESGLFCAYNAGTTYVTLSAGGLSYTLPVTIQAGSVRRPCGTVPVKKGTIVQPIPSPPPPVNAQPSTSPPPTSAPPPVPPAPVIALVPPAATPKPAPPPTFVVPAALSSPTLSFVPPPVPTPARPTPPSGTSAVTSPVEVAQEEEESEEAPESVSNKAVAYRSDEHEPAPYYLLGIVLLAALAGASVCRPRRGRREVRIAPATVSSRRAQQRWRSRDRRL